MDVHQLADVFESFRAVALMQDQLDPVNYVSVPGKLITNFVIDKI